MTENPQKHSKIHIWGDIIEYRSKNLPLKDSPSRGGRNANILFLATFSIAFWFKKLILSHLFSKTSRHIYDASTDAHLHVTVTQKGPETQPRLGSKKLSASLPKPLEPKVGPLLCSEQPEKHCERVSDQTAHWRRFKREKSDAGLNTFSSPWKVEPYP